MSNKYCNILASISTSIEENILAATNVGSYQIWDFCLSLISDKFVYITQVLKLQNSVQSQTRNLDSHVYRSFER